MNRPDAALRVAVRCLLLGVGLVAAVLMLGSGPAHADLRGTLGQAGSAAETVVSSTAKVTSTSKVTSSKVTSTAKKVKKPLSSVRHTVQRTVRRDAVRQTVDQPVRRAVTTVRHRNASATVVKHVHSSAASQVRRTPVVRKVMPKVAQPTTKKAVRKTAGQVRKALAPARRAVERAVPVGRTGKVVVNELDHISTTVKALTGQASATTSTLHGITTPVLELLDPIVREVTPGIIEITAPSVTPPTVPSSIGPAPSVPGTLPVIGMDQQDLSPVSADDRASQAAGTNSSTTEASRVGGFSALSEPTEGRTVGAQGHLDTSGPAVVDRLETTAPSTSPTLTGATGVLSASYGSVLWCSIPPAPLDAGGGAAILRSAASTVGAWHLTRDPGFSPD